MNRYYLCATLALLAMVALGCTREKPAEPESTPPPQNITTQNTPAPGATSGAFLQTPVPTGPVPLATTGITTTTGVTPTVETSAAPTSTVSLPPVFSPLPPINPTSAPSGVSAATPTSAPSTSSSGPTTYTVQWGDWLSKIARQFGVTNESIVAANPGMNPNFLVPGQVLNIPSSSGSVPPAPGASPTPGSGSGPTTYTVQRGDWYYAIARKFGVTYEALLAANPGVNPNFVYPGQVLNIPGSSAPPTNPPNTPVPGGRPGRYTVQPGDTLYSIAVRFNTTIFALQIVNHLPSPHFIYPGQVLIIPK